MWSTKIPVPERDTKRPAPLREDQSPATSPWVLGLSGYPALLFQEKKKLSISTDDKIQRVTYTASLIASTTPETCWPANEIPLRANATPTTVRLLSFKNNVSA